MQINCSFCDARHEMSMPDIQELPHSIFTCRQCGKFIKVTFCPHCSAFYSITFSAAKSEQYRLSCKKCAQPFVIDFPRISDPIVPKKQPATVPGPTPRKEERVEKPGARSAMKSAKTRPPKKEQSTLPVKGITFSEFTVRELLVIIRGSFSPIKIAVASAGVLAFFGCITLYRQIENILFAGTAVLEILFFKQLFSLLPFMLFFYIFLLTTAIISRISMEELFFNSRWTIAKVLRSLSRIWLPVLVSNVFVIMLFNILLLLFSKIPFIGPLVYPVIFLPVYTGFMGMVVFSVIGFWFYPPLVAYRDVGIVKNIANFYRFIVKHNLDLLGAIILLMMSTGIIFSLMYMGHHAAVSITVYFSRMIVPEEASRLFSAVPFGFIKLTDLSVLWNDLDAFKSLLGGLLFSHQIGGFLMGALLTLMSMVLLASFLSITGTISSHVYLMLERGDEMDDRKKIRLLVILVLALAGILLLKMIFL